MQKLSSGGIFMVLGAAVLWGTTGTAQSFAPALFSPYWVGALRLAIACAFFAGYVLLTRPGGRLTAQLAEMPWRWVLLAGACIAVYNLTFFAGVKASGVAVGTAIAIGSGPVWAGLFQVLTTGKIPSFAWWTGTLLAVTGGSLMVIGKGERLYTSPIGIVLCLIAGFVYAAYALVNKHLVSRGTPATVTLCVFVTAAVIALLAASALSAELHTTPVGWTVVIYLGVVATGVAFLLFSSGLRRISGATGVTLALMEPLTAFLLAIVVVNERPAAMAYLGLSFVLAGLAVVIWTEIKSDK